MGSYAYAVALRGAGGASVDTSVESAQSTGAVDVADLALVVGVLGAASLAASTNRSGSDGAGSHALVVVLVLVSSARGGGLALALERLVSAGAANAEVGTEAGLAVGTARLAPAAEGVGVVGSTAVGHTHTVQQILSVEASHSLSDNSGVPGAPTEAVVIISAEAASEHAETLIEEEARVADPLADTTAADGLTVVALGGRHAPLGGGVDEESTDALGTGVDVSGALGAVGVARLTHAVDGGEAGLAAGNTLAVAHNSGNAGTNSVPGNSTNWAALLALVVEVVETAEAALASASVVTSGTGVRALRADTASGSDGGVGAAGAVVEGRASLAVG